MSDPIPPDAGPPAPGPDGTTRPRKRKRVRRRITDNDPEVRGAKLVARLTNPSLWMWIAYAMVGLAVTIFLLSRSIGRVPGAPG